ncbi:MAG: Sensors of blue-light using FAD [Porphyrobacter sp. HL-46]|nr:MAG: Sensors of blue-light using FAD [Porphyrobacter sp. HL-46]
MISLLYISKSAIHPGAENSVVADIVAHANERNPWLGVTGALLFTGSHFAQVLEGETAVIEELIAKIRSDARHDDTLVVNRSPLTARRFAKWSMAYSGPSQFVSRHVTRLLNNPSPIAQKRAADWLTELLDEFSRDFGPAR